VSSLLYSLGRWAVRARRLVVAGWVVALVLVGGAAGLLQQGLDNAVTIPGTESQNALDRLATTFPQVSGASAQVIVVAPEGGSIKDEAMRSAITDGIKGLEDVSQVEVVTSPYDKQMPASISDDEQATLLTIQLDGDQGSITDATKDALHEEADALAQALPAGAEAQLGGQLFSSELPKMTLTEGIGLLVALVVLVLTLGSLVGAGLPLLNALLGVVISMGLLFAATALGPINSTTPLLAVMLGLAVGIDYALFIVSRHREQLAKGLAVDESIARATGTAGSAVVFAGLTVMIALVGLGVAGIPFLTTMGVAAAVTVGITVLVSLTLMPALLGFAGERLRPKPSRRVRRAAAKAAAVAVAAGDEPEVTHRRADVMTVPEQKPNRFFAGWVRLVTKVPALTVVLVIVAMGALSFPATDLRLALPDAGVMAKEDPARVTYDLVSEHFGDGFNGPLIVTGSIVTSTDPVTLMNDLGDEIADLPGVADVPLATPNETADTGIIQVIPEGGPTSAATEDLVREIRAQHDHFLDEYGVDLSVTGFTAVGIDVSDKLGNALLPFALVVVGLSLILLTMVFRSIAVPLKATIGYLFSVGAAFGVVSLVFEHGVFAEALNVTRSGPVISFMPIVLMGILFGLAMDYEVFLVSRMREDYVHGGSARHAITTGFQSSAKVVTAAAIIMIAVFVAFVPHGDMNIKPIALGLAVGVAVDAFVVRMVFVPAVLALLGDKAWYMPKWLDRVLPSFDVEGEGLARELSLTDWPEPGATDAVATGDLEVSSRSGLIVGPVSVRVPDGGTLLVRGDATAPVSAFLLAVSGRLRVTGGVAKTAGLVLPERASSVRHDVAVIDSAAEGGHPAEAVRRALRDKPRVLVVDATETVGDLTARAELAQAVAGAQRAGVAVLLGSTGSAATDLAPSGTPVLDVSAGARADSLSTERDQQTNVTEQEVRA
jgi:RND superfamily putative drug exporter